MATSTSFDVISLLQVRDPALASLLARVAGGGGDGQYFNRVPVYICEGGRLLPMLWPEHQLESNIAFLQ